MLGSHFIDRVITPVCRRDFNNFCWPILAALVAAANGPAIAAGNGGGGLGRDHNVGRIFPKSGIETRPERVSSAEYAKKIGRTSGCRQYLRQAVLVGESWKPDLHSVCFEKGVVALGY